MRLYSPLTKVFVSDTVIVPLCVHCRIVCIFWLLSVEKNVRMHWSPLLYFFRSIFYIFGESKRGQKCQGGEKTFRYRQEYISSAFGNAMNFIPVLAVGQRRTNKAVQKIGSIQGDSRTMDIHKFQELILYDHKDSHKHASFFACLAESVKPIAHCSLCHRTQILECKCDKLEENRKERKLQSRILLPRGRYYDVEETSSYSARDILTS